MDGKCRSEISEERSMAVFDGADDVAYCAKALKMGAEGARADFIAIDSWEKELAAQPSALFPGDIALRNPGEIPPDRNRSRPPEPAPREDDRAVLEVNILVDKPGYLARSSASRVERRQCSAQRFVMDFVISCFG